MAVLDLVVERKVVEGRGGCGGSGPGGGGRGGFLAE